MFESGTEVPTSKIRNFGTESSDNIGMYELWSQEASGRLRLPTDREVNKWVGKDPKKNQT